MKEKNEFEITLLDNDRKSKIRGGASSCLCSRHSSMVDNEVDELCDGEIMVDID